MSTLSRIQREWEIATGKTKAISLVRDLYDSYQYLTRVKRVPRFDPRSNPRGTVGPLSERAGVDYITAFGFLSALYNLAQRNAIPREAWDPATRAAEVEHESERKTKAVSMFLNPLAKPLRRIGIGVLATVAGLAVAAVALKKAVRG